MRAHVVTGIALGLATVAVTTLVSAEPQATPSPDALLARFAIDLGNSDKDVAPISLDADGSALHGVAYDRFTLAHLFARAAKSKSTPHDPDKPPQTLLSKNMIIVAVPLICSGRTVRPVDVDVIQGTQPVLKYAQFTAQDFRTWLPGAAVPAGAIGVMFNDRALESGEIVKIRYNAAACPDTSTTVLLPVTTSDARPLSRPVLEMAEGQTAPPDPVTLRIDGVVDLDGRLRYASSREPSTPVNKAALAAATALRFEPARINGSPRPWTAGVILTFSIGR